MIQFAKFSGHQVHIKLLDVKEVETMPSRYARRDEKQMRPRSPLYAKKTERWRNGRVRASNPSGSRVGWKNGQHMKKGRTQTD
jgi:hypothetical protein